MNDKIKKNLLDLKYNKCLQFYNTTIISIISYTIALGIAIATKQINYTNPTHLFISISFSIIFFFTTGKLLSKFQKQLKKIPQMIAKLNIS